MNIRLVDLQSQYQSLQAELDAAILGVVRRGDFILGAEVGQFEAEFANFIGTRHCIGVASGTDALFLSLRALDIGPGDKVLLPANTFIATALAVSDAGATPVLCDIDPLSHTIDVLSARQAIVRGVKAIIPVHLYGQTADMEGVLDLAREKGLLVIEDAAQAHGAGHQLGRVGTFGTAAAFSFYPGKNLGAYGDGGAICTNDAWLAGQLCLLRNWGSTVKYFHRVRGYNSRLDTMQAAVLRVKMRHLAEWNRRRREIAGWYREGLAHLEDEIELPREAPWCREHVYHLFVVRLKHADRNRVLAHLKSVGIGAGIHYPVPIHLQEAYPNLGGPGSFPVTERISQQILSLPMYPELTPEQVRFVCRELAEGIGQNKPGAPATGRSGPSLALRACGEHLSAM
jgi:dTDP-4-amino-4,6-dideoxygalactose transaminase